MEIDGVAGGGMVKVTLNGKGEPRADRDRSALLEPADTEMLEDLIVAAANDAKAQGRGRRRQEEMRRSPAACRCRRA